MFLCQNLYESMFVATMSLYHRPCYVLVDAKLFQCILLDVLLLQLVESMFQLIEFICVGCVMLIKANATKILILENKMATDCWSAKQARRAVGQETWMARMTKLWSGKINPVEKSVGTKCRSA